MSEDARVGSLIPRPDPSALTTEALERERMNVHDDLVAMQGRIKEELAMRHETRQREMEQQNLLFSERVSSIKDNFNAQIESINQATQLRLKAMEQFPGDVRAAVEHHEELQIERFKGINQQFNERDIRTAQAQEASAQALAAALQAAKELVGAQGEASAAAAVKSETSFTKQIDQIGTIIQTLEKALDARITELKERIDRGEGNDSGHNESRVEGRSQQNSMIGFATMAIMMAGLIITIILRTH